MRQWILTVTLVLCSVQPLCASGAPSAPAQIIEVEGVHEYRLVNGLQVLLIPDASKATVTVNVTYRVGSRMENYGETGMAHLLEHLMFKSTRQVANVGAELSKRGMQFNGTTSDDRTNYYETFPSDATQLSWALKTEAERMTGAKVLKQDLDSEMTVVRNEMEMGENNAINILVQKTAAAAYQWHNYGKSTIGARSDVENVNIPHLQAFYRKYYQPDNATLIVAGAFDAAKVLQEISSDFGAIPRPSRSIEPTYTLEPVQDGEREVTLRRVGGERRLCNIRSDRQRARRYAKRSPAQTPSRARQSHSGRGLGIAPGGARTAESGRRVEERRRTRRCPGHLAFHRRGHSG
jgi:zinc protease